MSGMVKNGSYKNKLESSILLTVAYALMVIIYFAVIDKRFYVIDFISGNVSFVMPFPLFIITGIYIYFYSRVLKQDSGSVIYPVLAVTMVLSLVYLLTEFRVNLSSVNPYRHGRAAYEAYAKFYCMIAISIFSVIAGRVTKRAVKGDATILYLTVFICFICVEAALLIGGLFTIAAWFLLLFLTSLSIDTVPPVLKEISRKVVSVIKDERFIIAMIFVIALIVRFFWGMRIISMIGSRYLLASDDGQTYDLFAAILAQGGVIPKENALFMSGFGYWYFLALIYKLFGVHNFKAAISIQAVLGAMVPILTYYIGKIVFKNKFVATLAAVMTALDMNLVFLSAVIGMEAIYIPLLMLAMAVAVYLLSRGEVNYKKCFLIGIFFGLANNARPEVFLFPFVIAFLIYMLAGRARRMSFVIITLAVVAGALLMMSIQGVTTYMLYKDPHLIPSRGAASSFTVTVGPSAKENQILSDMGFNPFDNMRKSVSTFFEKPFTVSRLVAAGFAKRICIYYFMQNFGVFDAICLISPGSGHFFRFPFHLQFYLVMFILFGIASLFIARRENVLAKAILLAFPAYLSCLYALIWVRNARYKGVLMPIFMLFFAYGVSVFVGKVRKSQKK